MPSRQTPGPTEPMITVHFATLTALTILIGSSCSEAPAEGVTSTDPEGHSEEASPQYDGSVLYGRFCLSCHGETGIGDGVSAKMLTIKPRDFTAGIFKFRSVVEGLPTDADLARTIAKGIGGTEMSAYETLPPEAIDALVQHVKSLTVGNI
ncbi:MAG TPA: cytochrome c, partial [Planctomycetes bacterium]|nr:cytochrome c [Planctomycetota bacterium]